MKLAKIALTVYALMAVYHELDKTKVIEVSRAQEEYYEAPDPCGLTVVVCDSVDIAVVDREDKPVKGESIGREHIEALIDSSFGEESENAKKVFMCESHYDPKIIGDTKIAFWKNGHLYGRSIGIAQIRMLPGRTDNPEVYEKELMNPERNIIEAKKIFDKQGWGAWRNCARMNGIIF